MNFKTPFYLLVVLVAASLILGAFPSMTARVPYLGAYAQAVHSYMIGADISAESLADTLSKGRPLVDELADWALNPNFWVVVAAIVLVFARKQLLGKIQSDPLNLLFAIGILLAVLLVVRLGSNLLTAASILAIFLSAALLSKRAVTNTTGYAENLAKTIVGGIVRTVMVLVLTLSVPTFVFSSLNIDSINNLLGDRSSFRTQMQEQASADLAQQKPFDATVTTLKHLGGEVLFFISDAGANVEPEVGGLVALGAFLAVIIMLRGNGGNKLAGGPPKR